MLNVCQSHDFVMPDACCCGIGSQDVRIAVLCTPALFGAFSATAVPFTWRSCFLYPSRCKDVKNKVAQPFLPLCRQHNSGDVYQPLFSRRGAGPLDSHTVGAWFHIAGPHFRHMSVVLIQHLPPQRGADGFAEVHHSEGHPRPCANQDFSQE